MNDYLIIRDRAKASARGPIFVTSSAMGGGRDATARQMAQEAKASADNANNTADDARLRADNALERANNAQNTATVAQNTADSAQAQINGTALITGGPAKDSYTGYPHVTQGYEKTYMLTNDIDLSKPYTRVLVRINNIESFRQWITLNYTTRLHGWAEKVYMIINETAAVIDLWAEMQRYGKKATREITYFGTGLIPPNKSAMLFVAVSTDQSNVDRLTAQLVSPWAETATKTAQGLMSSADKAKLDGIETCTAQDIQDIINS